MYFFAGFGSRFDSQELAQLWSKHHRWQADWSVQYYPKCVYSVGYLG